MDTGKLRSKQTSPLSEGISGNLHLLSLIVDNIPQAVFWKDQNLVYLGCNQAFAEDAGLETTTQVIGKTDYDMPWTDQADLYREDDAQVMESGQAKINYEEPQTNSSGEITWLRTSKIPVRDDDGNVIAVLGMYEDITEEKRAEQLLQESEERLQAIYHGTNDAVMLLTPKGFFDCNERTLELFGFETVEEFTKVHPADISPPNQPDGSESFPAAQKKIQTAYENGYHRFEWVHRRTSGEDFPAEVLLSAFEIDGEMVLQATVRDITERKQVEERTLIFQTLAENAPDAITMSDLEGNISYANRAAYELLGFDDQKQELIGKPTLLLAPPEERERQAQAIDQIMATGVSWSEDAIASRSDGSTVNISITMFPVLDSNGQPAYLAAILRDISAQKEAERALGLSEQLLHSFLENYPDGVWAKDIEGRFLLANRIVVEKIAGSEVIGKTVYDTMPKENADMVWASEKHLLETGEPISVEEDVPHADGKIYQKMTTKFPIYDAEGNISGVGGVLIDITEQKMLQNQLQEAYDRRGEQVQISTEIAQEIAQASELSDLFDRVVTLTKERLGYYHTQLLRYEPVLDAIVLITGYGKTGAQMLTLGHSMPLGSGLIGAAAAKGETVMRPDLAVDPDWKPNPLLPETKGEIAVPIKLGNEILGVLDIQSDQVGALTADDQLLLEGLCGQIAIAIDQTRLRQEMEDRLTEINRLYRTMSREGWESFTSSITLPEGYQYDQAGVREIDSTEDQESLVSAPLTIPGGHTVGMLSISATPDAPLSPEDQAFLEQVSEQVALALESARLSEQTQAALARTDELYGISQAINEATTETDIIEAIARPAMENGAASAVLIYLDYNETGVPEWAQIVANWGLGEGQASVSVGQRFYLPEMPLSKLWMSDPENPLLISEIRTDTRVDDIARSLIEQSGSHALSIIPLTRRGEQIGLIVFNWDQPHKFSPQESETYRAIIDLASPAVQSRRLFEQTQAALAAVQESEAQLTEALEIAKLGYWEYDFANDEFILTDNFYSIFHTTAEKMGGYRMSSSDYSEKFVHPEDAKLVGEEIEKALATNERFFSTQVEHRILYQDGGEGYITVNINLERDENGNIIRWHGANQDITERKFAEEAVRLAQERAQTILETVTLPMVITRLSDNTMTFSNQPAAEIIGMDLEELVDTPAPDFFTNPDEGTQFVEELKSQGFVNNLQVVLKRGDQSTFWALLSGRVFTYQGEPSILTTITDISERIQAQEATAKRAAELATVAEVGTTISTILEEQPLLETVVQQTRERFKLYHCHIFLADANNQTLQVKACGWESDSPHIGTVEQVLIHSDQEQSLVAQAARDQKAIIVNDVRSDPNWLANELLPETRSEMAIPLIAGNQVLGVLDVQADEVDRFTEEDISIMTTLASQVAVALQNSRTYAQTQRQAEYEAMINQISQRIQSTTSVENALQVAIRELGRALGAKRTNIQLGLPNQKKSG